MRVDAAGLPFIGGASLLAVVSAALGVWLAVLPFIVLAAFFAFFFRDPDRLSPQATNLVLSPAACYPVYPIAASRGQLPQGGLRFDVAADCFRREPSRHLDRLQSFRMREYVCIGTPDDVSAFRDRWMERAQGIARDLGLTFRVDYASDPFFGRVGQMKAVSQKQQSLKFELLVPLRSEEQPTACMSFNYHREHFGTTWDIQDANGEPAHTGCVAFGMDRLAVAMFHTHGAEPATWPSKVRDLLAMTAHAAAGSHGEGWR